MHKNWWKISAAIWGLFVPFSCSVRNVPFFFRRNHLSQSKPIKALVYLQVPFRLVGVYFRIKTARKEPVAASSLQTPLHKAVTWYTTCETISYWKSCATSHEKKDLGIYYHHLFLWWWWQWETCRIWVFPEKRWYPHFTTQVLIIWLLENPWASWYQRELAGWHRKGYQWRAEIQGGTDDRNRQGHLFCTSKKGAPALLYSPKTDPWIPKSDGFLSSKTPFPKIYFQVTC